MRFPIYGEIGHEVSEHCELTARFSGDQLDVFASITNPETTGVETISWEFKAGAPLSFTVGARTKGSFALPGGERSIVSVALRMPETRIAKLNGHALVEISYTSTPRNVLDGDLKTLSQLMESARWPK